MDFRIVIRSLVWAVAAVASLQSAQAQPGAPASRPTYTCIDAAGRPLTGDRSIPECWEREQRVLNADGSLREIIKPQLTAEQRVAEEKRKAAKIEEERVRKYAIKSDLNLLDRFPDEVAHRKEREAALETARKALAVSDERMATLALERKRLMSEAEFYIGKPLPLKLRAQLDANDAGTDAQRSAIQTQQADMARINGLYNTQLERLRSLWSGAPAGSMGTLPVTASAATSSTTR